MHIYMHIINIVVTFLRYTKFDLVKIHICINILQTLMNLQLLEIFSFNTVK